MSLKIYFFGSIWGQEADVNVTQAILGHLKTKGEVLSEYLFSEDYKSSENLDVRQIHDRDLNWIGDADVLVGDVTSPSLGVGYEIRHGISQKKPILALYKSESGKRLSAMIDGSPEINVGRYESIEEAIKNIDDFLAEKFGVQS